MGDCDGPTKPILSTFTAWRARAKPSRSRPSRRHARSEPAWAHRQSPRVVAVGGAFDVACVPAGRRSPSGSLARCGDRRRHRSRRARDAWPAAPSREHATRRAGGQARGERPTAGVAPGRRSRCGEPRGALVHRRARSWREQVVRRGRSRGRVYGRACRARVLQRARMAARSLDVEDGPPLGAQLTGKKFNGASLEVGTLAVRRPPWTCGSAAVPRPKVMGARDRGARRRRCRSSGRRLRDSARSPDA